MREPPLSIELRCVARDLGGFEEWLAVQGAFSKLSLPLVFGPLRLGMWSTRLSWQVDKMDVIVVIGVLDLHRRRAC